MSNAVTGKMFGVNVWWTCPEMIVDAETVKTSLLKNGFEADDIPTPSRRTEVSRAAYSFQNRLGKSNRRVTEKANDNANCVVYGILDREQEATDTVGFTQHTTIKLDKATDAVSVEGALYAEVLEAIKVYSGKITDEDIRYFLRRVIAMCYGVSKRPTGGIYFVPDLSVMVIKSAQAFLNDLGLGAKLYVEGVVNGTQERQNVWEAVEEDIETRLSETLSAVERIERRTNAVKDHGEKVKGLNKILDVYRDLLGEEAKYQDVSEKIEEAVKVIAAKMTTMQKGTAAVLSTPAPAPAAPVPVAAPAPVIPAPAAAPAKIVKAKKAAMPPPPADPSSKPAKKVYPTGDKWVKAAVAALTVAASPLHYTEITAKAIAAGFQTKDTQAAIRMSIWMNASIKKGEGFLKACGKGVYALA
jgi:hypothetical protein